MQKVILQKDECYCGIDDLYKRVAVKLGVSPDDVYFDCTKICVTKPVMDQMGAYYKEEQHASAEAIAQCVVLYGPKASVPGDGYEVEIQEGFFEEAIPLF